MFYHENKYIKYHLTIIVNFDNFTFAALYCQMMT